jgi:hypothetical protein
MQARTGTVGEREEERRVWSVGWWPTVLILGSFALCPPLLRQSCFSGSLRHGVCSFPGGVATHFASACEDCRGKRIESVGQCVVGGHRGRYIDTASVSLSRPVSQPAKSRTEAD